MARRLQPVFRFGGEHLRGHPDRGCRARLGRAGRAPHLVAAHGRAGDLQHGQPAAFDVLAVRDRPLPVDRRRVLPGLLPAGPRRGADGDPHCRRSRAMGPARARHRHPDAGVRRILLVLRDRADSGRPTRPERAQVRAGAELHRPQLPHAAGLRRAADALGRHAHPAPGPDAAHARLLVDVRGRHRLGHVQGGRQLHSGQRLGRHLPVLLHLACGRRARAAAWQAWRAPRPECIQRRTHRGNAVHRHDGVVPGAGVRREQHGRQPREHDDRHHLRADLAGHGAPGRALARRRAAARTACGRHRRGPLCVPDQERLRRDHDHQRRGNAAIRLAGGRTHLCDPPGRHGGPESPRSLGRWRQRAAGCIPRRGVGDAWPGRWTDRADRRDQANGAAPSSALAAT